jgi:hypothetical protein
MSGTYGNMNHTDDTLRKALEGIEENYKAQVTAIRQSDGSKMAEQEFDINPEDPFWKAMYRGQKKWDTKSAEEWAAEAQQDKSDPFGPEIEIDQNQ